MKTLKRISLFLLFSICALGCSEDAISPNTDDDDDPIIIGDPTTPPPDQSNVQADTIIVN